MHRRLNTMSKLNERLVSGWSAATSRRLATLEDIPFQEKITFKFEFKNLNPKSECLIKPHRKTMQLISIINHTNHRNQNQGHVNEPWKSAA